MDEKCWDYYDEKLQLELDHSPELSDKGGAVRLDGKGLPYGILIIYGNDEEYHAFMNKCTHSGRKIDPVKGRKRLQCCSLGRSTWDYSGRLISGSAKDNLPVLEVKKSAGKLIISVPER